MTIAWYDPTNHHVSTDKHDPLFTPLGQLWHLHRIPSPLTDEEIKECSYDAEGFMISREVAMRNVEKAHGIGEKK